MNLLVLGVLLVLACEIEGGIQPPIIFNTGINPNSKRSRAIETAASPPPIIAILLGQKKGRATDLEVPILRADSVANSEGYKYGYETGNGISAEASGALKKVATSDVFSVQGQYRYTSPEGTPVDVRYVADENGYRIVE